MRRTQMGVRRKLRMSLTNGNKGIAVRDGETNLWVIGFKLGARVRIGVRVRVRFALMHCFCRIRGIMHDLPAWHSIVRESGMA